LAIFSKGTPLDATAKSSSLFGWTLFFLSLTLLFVHLHLLLMGNQISKKKKQDRTSRSSEQEDNVFSTNTASSVSSILKASGNNNPLPGSRPQSLPSSLPNERPRDPSNDTNGNGDYSTSPMEQNQFTVGSQSQLTATSFRSIGRTLDIDDCIQKLLDVGYSDKVLKSFCLKNSEINAICRVVSDIFMSQPVRIISLLSAAPAQTPTLGLTTVWVSS
jgi:hypothetical protein